MVVDDQRLVREGIAKLLSLSGDIRAVGQAADGRQAIHQVKALRPDVLLLDVRMPGWSGLETLGALSMEGLSLPIGVRDRTRAALLAIERGWI